MNADGTEAVQLPPVDGGSLGPPVWSPDGSQIAFDGWIDEDGFEIWVMNADGSGLRNLTNTPEATESSPSWSPDGRRILFSGAEGLEVMNSDGSGRTPFFSEDGHLATWSPDGARIAFLSTLDERSRLFTMSVDGSDPLPLTADDGGHDLVASWSPTGTRLAYIHELNSSVEVYVINADGTGAVNISDNDSFDYMGPQAWGP